MSVAISEPIGSHVPISADELLALPNEKDFELVNGQLVEHHMGFESSHIALELLTKPVVSSSEPQQFKRF